MTDALYKIYEELAQRATNTLGKEMTKEDINYIVNAFAQSARRAKESGFDGIEIQGAHTYLINQFLSPYYNRRTDENRHRWNRTFR